MRRLGLVFLAGLVVFAAVGYAMWAGLGPIPDPEGCTATVDGRTVTLSTEQSENATLIAAIGVRRGLPARAVSIALATAYQESKITNLSVGDRDSLGLFQQRPSQGWGTEEEIMNPYYSINAFYDALERIDGYESMRITEAAQEVQRSGFPEAYEDHAPDARALASALTGYSDGGQFTCVVRDGNGHGTAKSVAADLEGVFGIDAVGSGDHVDVSIPSGEEGARLEWAVAAYAVAQAERLHIAEVSVDGRLWETGRASEKGWRTADTPAGVRVRVIGP
jgi:hypothetical protein